MPQYKVLVLDPLAEEGQKILKADPEVTMDMKLKLSPAEIKAIIGEYHGVIVRSESKLTADILAAGKNLKVVGRAGVGLDNIDVEAATQHGIIVTNTPDANTLSTAELTMSLMLGLARKIAGAAASLREGKWERSKFKGVEVYGKTLGIVGLGRIGKEVAKRSQAFGMKIIAYDPYVQMDQAKLLGIEPVSLAEIIKLSDFITVHVPLTKETTQLFGAKEFGQMKKSVRLINCARGGIYNEKELAEALKSGQVAGAAVDVYENEPPPPDHPLLGLDNVLAVPHLGASTDEAQLKVSIDMAEQILQGLKGGPNLRAVNMPTLDPVALKELQPYINLVDKMSRFLAQEAEDAIKEVRITYAGDVSKCNVMPLTLTAIKGILDVQMKEGVNFVNAPVLAKARGMNIIESKSESAPEYSSLITLRVDTGKGVRHTLAGALVRGKMPRFVSIDDYDTDVEPTDFMVVLTHMDRPGLVGHLGNVLGSAGINIAGLHVGRDKVGGKAVAIVSVDSDVPDKVMAELAKHKDVERVKLVRMVP